VCWFATILTIRPLVVVKRLAVAAGPACYQDPPLPSSPPSPRVVVVLSYYYWGNGKKRRWDIFAKKF
jgi:hypothetical protein